MTPTRLQTVRRRRIRCPQHDERRFLARLDGLALRSCNPEAGHPVAIFLNLDAVKLAAKSGEQEKKPSMQRVPRDVLADFIKDGGIVLMCGPCMTEFGLKLDDLVPGVQMGRPATRRVSFLRRTHAP